MLDILDPVTTTYRIVVKGALSERFASGFDGVRMESGEQETTLIGELVDQGQLHGLLDRLWDLGFELLRVEAVQA